MVPSVGMIKSSPQENGCSVDPRTEKASGVTVYLGSSRLKVSDKIVEEGVMDVDEGSRFEAISMF